MSRPRLTPVLQQRIAASIRAGGFPHVAAEAWGVSRDTFADWLKRGERPGARGPYAAFAAEVRRAVAQARLRAESFALDNKATTWLEHGPGRDRPGNPGWTSQAAASVQSSDFDPWRSSELLGVFREMLKALAPFPEARLRVAPIFDQRGIRIPPGDGSSAAA